MIQKQKKLLSILVRCDACLVHFIDICFKHCMETSSLVLREDFFVLFLFLCNVFFFFHQWRPSYIYAKLDIRFDFFFLHILIDNQSQGNKQFIQCLHKNEKKKSKSHNSPNDLLWIQAKSLLANWVIADIIVVHRFKNDFAFRNRKLKKKTKKKYWKINRNGAAVKVTMKKSDDADDNSNDACPLKQKQAILLRGSLNASNWNISDWKL